MKKELCLKVSEFIMSRDDDQLKDLNVSRIAEHFQVDLSYLLRMFQDYLKVDLEKYITQQKICRAASMCHKDCTIPLDEIAEKTGFDDPAQFKKLFVYYFGVSPREFAKQRRKLFPPHEFN
ncbi:MAG: helix-turn-helix domain-containing protein [Candidatus Aminicenantes bacterium]|nr:helix-turn-helix domain-containing protein [Candidatus Aminicenantes bacterium]